MFPKSTLVKQGSIGKSFPGMYSKQRWKSLEFQAMFPENEQTMFRKGGQT
jgi:hypothetical protein